MSNALRTPTQLGNALRQRRKDKTLSQAQLSGQIGKRQATISSLEAVGQGTLETLFSVLSALDLELAIRPRSKSGRKAIEDIF